MTPTGAVRTTNPQNGPFNLQWPVITQWEDEARIACDQFGAPLSRVMATVVIESGGRANAVQRNPSNGDSYGLMQIVPFGVGWNGWHARVKQVAGLSSNAPASQVRDALFDPLTNLRVGCSILRDLHAQHGTWDRASSTFFLGNPDWRGQDTVNGNTGDGYRRSLSGLIAEYGQGEPVPDEINWEPLPRPVMRRAIVTKAQDGDGFNRTSSRGPRTIGCCNHITDGDPSGDEIEWYRAFFSIGGERARDALVDTIIARNGEIGLLNDWEDDQWGGTRAGWANGKTDGLSAVGSAIVARYPGNQINEVFVSKEHVARSGQSITDAQMSSSIALSSYVAQRARVRWDTYPKNGSGLVVDPLHTDFAAKACPAEPFISTYYPVLTREVKAILTKHQTGSTNPDPIPEPEPVPGLPAWLTEGHVKAAFPDFSPQGIVSQALVRYIAKSGTLPVFREKREAGEKSGLWVFDRVTIIHEGTSARYEGEAP